MAGGRPLKYETPEALEDAVQGYLESFKGDALRCPTLTGLAVHLDMDRRSLLNYENRDEFFPVIKRARTVIEATVEEYLLGAKGNVTGAIFWLKNNADWIDNKTHTTMDEDGKQMPINVNVNFVEP